MKIKIADLFYWGKRKFLREFSCIRYSVTLVCVLFFLLFITALLVFVIDPYLYWHKSWIGSTVYKESYARIPGVLKHEKYDTVLFGSSMCQIFHLNDINDAFQCKAVKATSPGLPGEALDQYLKQALKNGGADFKRAIIGLDYWAFAKNPAESPRLQYDYLYKDEFFPIKYLVSADTVSAIAELVKYNFRHFVLKKKVYQFERNLMFGHQPRPERYNRERLYKYVKTNTALPMKIKPQAYKFLDKFLFEHIRLHPEISFELFFPPYNVFFWCTIEKHDFMDEYLEFRNHIIREAAKYSNVKLHDFQAEKSIVCDFDSYQDITHYNVETGKRILYLMAEGKYRVQVNNGLKNTQLLRQNVETFMPVYLNILSDSKK